MIVEFRDLVSSLGMGTRSADRLDVRARCRFASSYSRDDELDDHR